MLNRNTMQFCATVVLMTIWTYCATIIAVNGDDVAIVCKFT